MAFVLTAYNDVHKFSHSYLSCTPSFISSCDDVIFKHDVSQVVIYWRENSKNIFYFKKYKSLIVIGDCLDIIHRVYLLDVLTE